MLPLLMALLPLLGGITQPIKDWFTYKQQAANLAMQVTLANITAQSNLVTAQLNCTSSQFKQQTFWFLCVPIVYTMFCPERAAVMWGNFNTIPQMFQYLFMTVYGSIWGIPLAQDGHSLILGLLQQRSDNKVAQIQAAQLDETALANKARELLFPKGMTESEWQAIVNIAKAGCSVGSGA